MCMDFARSLSEGIGGFAFGNALPYVGLIGLGLFVLITIVLAYHWWKYTFTGDALVLPAAILYGVGSVLLLSVIITTL